MQQTMRPSMIREHHARTAAAALPFTSVPPGRETLEGKDVSSMAFTPQHENQELSTLTTADIVNLESDLQGITAGINRVCTSDRSQSLIQLEQELDKISPHSKTAYLDAQVQCPSLVSDQRKLVFLERDDGNAAAAASRLVDYWTNRLAIFGPDRCFLPMTLDGAMKGMESDIVHRRLSSVLPVKDSSGRAIIFLQPGRRNFDEFSPEQEAMVWWYMLETALEDPDVRRRGIVYLCDGRGVERRHYNLYLMRIITSMSMCIPYHARAMHLCHPSAVGYYVVYPVLKSFLGRHLRLRFKMHRGSDEEIVTVLGRYRLPRACVPTELGGDLVVAMEAFVAERLVSERLVPCQTQSNSGAAAVAAATSVAVGVGVPPAKRRLVEDNRTSHGMGFSFPTASLSVSVSSTATKTSSNSKKAGKQRKRRRKKKKSGSKRGMVGDPRMEKSIRIRLANPHLPLRDTLVLGGFVFNTIDEAGDEIDDDGIRLDQRRNQLSRRIRLLKKGEEEGNVMQEAA
mmetsp:Transcript_31941/g.65018  ORF Transcript_31941/g.65018 Transcript_31941/m.65018 type:complete len:512 (+) Transcript_31941:313-1848(+)